MFAGTAGLSWLYTWPWWSRVLASYLNKAQVNAPALSPGLDCDTSTALHAWSHPHSTLGLPTPRHVLICALCPRETLSKALLLFSHSVVSDSLQPHGLQHARVPCPLLSPSLLKLMSMELVMPSNHLILCHPLLPLHLSQHQGLFK